ncbi:40S ribosomal protein [Quillaja saponaria]|uniref:40S ribosomal protein n=1 Tax=Quillaja saponaria TaxID=32244 RepID=A0AAD7Q1N7_QUISA|nr:40S ribosomal protein [Quillaja saponaria]
MALRRLCGFSDGELMRSDAKPCSRLMRQTAGIFTVGGGLGFWILCRLHYGSSNYSSKEFSLGSLWSSNSELNHSFAGSFI